MKRRTSVAMVAVILTVLASVNADDRDSDAAAAVAKEYRQAVAAEVAEGHSADWAGTYYEGDGLGENVSISLAPRAGFVFEWHGCMGVYDRNYGAISVKDDVIQLKFTFQNEKQGLGGIAPEFYVVRWGERRYLIPTDGVIDFCNDINAGREPRAKVHGAQLLRREDQSKDVKGFPTLPPKYDEYLLSKPIEGKIVTTGKPTTRPSVLEDYYFFDTPVTINVGHAEGVRIGMKLYAIDEKFSSDITVKAVSEHESTGTISEMEKAPSAFTVGGRVTTQGPWAMVKSAR